MKRVRTRTVEQLIESRLAQLRDSNFKIVKNTEVIHKENREFCIGLQCKTCDTCFLQKFNADTKSSFVCPCCFINRIRNTFSKSTYEFLYHVNDIFHFRCSCCSSLKTFSLSGIVNHPADCVECRKIACTKRLNENGYYVDKIEGVKFTIRCKTCDSIRKLKDCSVVSRVKLYCHKCDKKKVRFVKRQVGFEILYEDLEQSICRCVTCGYFRKNLFINGPDRTHCLNCKRLSFEQRIKEENSTLIDYDDDSKTVTVKLPSGENKEVTVGHFMDDKRGHLDKGTWGSPTCVYAIIVYFDGKAYCKIGTAINPEERRKNLKLSGESSVSVLGRFKTRKEADEIEKLFHKAFAEHKISPKEAEKFSNRLTPRGKLDGINEWFDVGVVGKIYRIINGIYTNPTSQAGGS